MTVDDSKDFPYNDSQKFTPFCSYSWEIHPHFDDDPPDFQPLPESKPPPSPEVQIDLLHAELNRPKNRIKKQADRIRFQTSALDNVGMYLYRGFHHGEWGNRASLRRLISGIFGARDYKVSESG